ncbi:MAG: AarF/ABC1/UbiB kinase family protein [Myxococcales bacterium]|nr:AarF/ABC1/UbiB kinase family protein [Myxococcales bacterium]
MGWISTLLACLALFAVALWLVLRHLARRRNAAGISTSIVSRTTQVGSLLTRSFVRRFILRLRSFRASLETKKRLEGQYHLQTAAEATQMLGNMKGVMMKIGQIMSFAADSMPEDAQKLLTGLQTSAPPMDFHLVRQVLEEDLGGDIGRFFGDIDEEPIAAASIGQVHRARLHDGSQVVAKVQYPGVDEAIENDLKFSQGIAFMINAVQKNADAEAVVAELKERIVDELDYRKELRNQQLFYDLWGGHPYIRIPRVFPEVSAKRVLVQSYQRGLGFYDFVAQANEREKQLAVFVLNDFVFDSMHRFHVFNGDPHPGNYIFHEDGGITFLDFGCIKYFAEPFMADLMRLNRALVEGDRATFDQQVLKLQLILPGRPYDSDWMWEFFCYHAGPFRLDRVFTFTPQWIEEAKTVMNPKNLTQLNLPPDLIFFNRITFGLNAIFLKLGASANFHRLYRRYLYPQEGVPPSLAVHGVTLEPRFLAADKQLVFAPSGAGREGAVVLGDVGME